MDRKDTVGYKIRLIHNQVHKWMEQKRTKNESDLALTGMQRWTIGFLMEHENETVYQRDIEEEFRISRATASNMISVMERKRLLSRLPVAHDARLKQLVLTELGRAIMEQANRDVCQMEETLLMGLSEGEIAALKRSLDKLLVNLSDKQEENTKQTTEYRKTH